MIPSYVEVYPEKSEKQLDRIMIVQYSLLKVIALENADLFLIVYTEAACHLHINQTLNLFWAGESWEGRFNQVQYSLFISFSILS